MQARRFVDEPTSMEQTGDLRLFQRRHDMPPNSRTVAAAVVVVVVVAVVVVATDDRVSAIARRPWRSNHGQGDVS